MVMSGEAAKGGDTNEATFDHKKEVKTELRELSPGSGQYGYLPIDEEIPVIRVPRPGGNIREIKPTPSQERLHHANLSGEAFGDDQPGFDTVEIPVVTHDYGPDA